MEPPSPAHHVAHPINTFDGDEDTLAIKKPLQKQDSKIGRWFSHVHDRLVMRLVCCAPASVVLEVEFEDEDFCRPQDTEIQKIEPNSASARGLQLKKQKSASVAPVVSRAAREPSDRDIPTNEELENLPIDLSFVLNDSSDSSAHLIPHPPPTPRHAALMQRAQQLANFRHNQSARSIQRRWRQIHATAAPADATNEGDKTDCETDTETGNGDRSTKTRRHRIRKHRGRKKKQNN